MNRTRALLDNLHLGKSKHKALSDLSLLISKFSSNILGDTRSTYGALLLFEMPLATFFAITTRIPNKVEHKYDSPGFLKATLSFISETNVDKYQLVKV